MCVYCYGFVPYAVSNKENIYGAHSHPAVDDIRLLCRLRRELLHVWSFRERVCFGPLHRFFGEETGDDYRSPVDLWVLLVLRDVHNSRFCNFIKVRSSSTTGTNFARTGRFSIFAAMEHLTRRMACTVLIVYIYCIRTNTAHICVPS